MSETAGDSAACQKCKSEISTEADRCPECGYEPAAKGGTTRWWMMFLGGLLTMTVIGAIIGIPMILVGYYATRKARGRKPTTYSP
jgi:hypothetical protein